jgi:hypothetical protein
MAKGIPRYWMATLFGGPYDGQRVAIETIYPRLNIFPTLDAPEAEYRRIDYDPEAATAAYLINGEEVSPDQRQPRPEVSE